MRFLILGAGMMGRALAFDLARSEGVDRVTLADAKSSTAQEAAELLKSPRVRATTLDVNDLASVVEVMRDHDCAIGAVSYRMNEALTKAAIDAGIHFCDLGGNDEVVGRQLAMTDAARHRGVTIIPNCGLAPGLVNVLAFCGVKKFERADIVRMRVGGVPRFPQPPLNYQIVFSVEGLLNEYSGMSAVLREGRVVLVGALTELEAIDFPPPFGRMEAFHTSGGASLVPRLLEGKVRHLDYKTVRYPGHCEKMRTLLELGFAGDAPVSLGGRILTERELFVELLKRRIPSTGPDVVLMRVTIEGWVDGKQKVLKYEMIDSRDEKHDISAMMRGTAYPTSVIAQQIAAGVVRSQGVMAPEQCIDSELLRTQLLQRGMQISEEWQEQGDRR